MQIPVQVSFHGMAASAALDALIRRRAGKLERFHPAIISCRAVVEEVARHRQQGRQFVARLDIRVRGAEIAVSREHSEDAFVAVREAFDAARRRLNQRRTSSARRRSG